MSLGKTPVVTFQDIVEEMYLPPPTNIKHVRESDGDAKRIALPQPPTMKLGGGHDMDRYVHMVRDIITASKDRTLRHFDARWQVERQALLREFQQVDSRIERLISANREEDDSCASDIEDVPLKIEDVVEEKPRKRPVPIEIKDPELDNWRQSLAVPIQQATPTHMPGTPTKESWKVLRNTATKTLAGVERYYEEKESGTPSKSGSRVVKVMAAGSNHNDVNGSRVTRSNLRSTGWQVSDQPSQVEDEDVGDSQFTHSNSNGEIKKSGRPSLVRSVTSTLSTGTFTAVREDLNEFKEDKSFDKTKAVFVDASAMKAQVRSALTKKDYNVMELYKTTGLAQKIARSTPFDNSTICVIGLNAIWIWIDCDYNAEAPTPMQSPWYFQIVEYMFCAYFTTEMIIRWNAFEIKRKAFSDRWFCFDGTLVVMNLFETFVLGIVFANASKGLTGMLGDFSILRILRLVRLTRLARMIRILKAMPELMILVKGMACAARSVFFTLCLLFMVIYIFSVAMKQLAEGTEVGVMYFETVPASMSTLLLHGCFGEELPDVVNLAGKGHFFLAALIIMFVLVATLMVMNMLVGVLVEVVGAVSAVEKEQIIVSYVKNQLLDLLGDRNIDGDQNKRISREEFQSLLYKPRAVKVIQDIGVDVIGLVDFADFILKDGIDISFGDFLEVVLQLRGTNVATVKDLVDLRKFLVEQLEEMNTTLMYLASNEASDKLSLQERLRSWRHGGKALQQLGLEKDDVLKHYKQTSLAKQGTSDVGIRTQSAPMAMLASK